MYPLEGSTTKTRRAPARPLADNVGREFAPAVLRHRSTDDPAFKSGRPEWFRRIAAQCEARSDQRHAEFCRRAARAADLLHLERALGKHWPLFEFVLPVLASLLRSPRRLPRGARLWVIRQALVTWLPETRPTERQQTLAILARCDERRLGRRLAELCARLRGPAVG